MHYTTASFTVFGLLNKSFTLVFKAKSRSQALKLNLSLIKINLDYFFLGFKDCLDGLVEDIPALHAGGRGSIPRFDLESFSISKCQLIASRGIMGP